MSWSTTRRGRDRALLALCAIATAAGTCGYWLHRNSEEITSLEATAQLVDGEPTRVRERITYDFGIKQRRGIFRIVPGLNPISGEVTVTSRTAPDAMQLIGTRIRIGDPDMTITGEHVYDISYDIETIDQAADFSWNVIGPEWDVPHRSMAARVYSDREILDPQCDVGTLRSRGGCVVTVIAPGVAEVRHVGVESREALTISGRLGSMIQNPSDVVRPQAPTPPQAPTTVFIGLFLWTIVSVCAWVVRGVLARAGRELVHDGAVADQALGAPSTGPVSYMDAAELANRSTIAFTPPQGLEAWQGGIVLREDVSDDHVIAWLLERDIAGDIRIETEGDARLLRGDDAAWGPQLHTMFDDDDEIDLTSYDPNFSHGFGQATRMMQAWQGRSGMWVSGMHGRPSSARWAAAATLLITLSAVGIAGQTSVVTQDFLTAVAAAAATTGAAGGLFTHSHELHVRTPLGSALWLQVESFRRFISESEAEHVEWAAEHGLLREYSAWAVALGHARHWSEIAAAAKIPDPDSAITLARDVSSFSSVTSSALTPSSSGAGGDFSGGGGGGGGGAGSGGGGGGGGSW